MNIMFLNSARAWGGTEKWMQMAAGALAGSHRVVVAYRSESVGRRVDAERIRLPFVSEGDPCTLARLLHLTLLRKIDVLIPTKPKEYVLAGVTAKALGRKNVLRLGIERHLGESPVKKLVYGRLAHGIIVNARSIRDGLLESSFMRAEKIRVIHNGVDRDRIDRLSNQPPERPLPFPFMFCSVGTVSRRKGSADLLAGFARFLELSGARDAGLVFLGGGDDLRRIERQAGEAGLGDRVVFRGFVENPYPAMRSCEAFVSCSKSEGISNALLEAMYLERAVVVTPAGGTREAVRDGENGLIAADAEAATVGALMNRIYRDERLRRNLGRRASRTVIDHFSLERMAEEIGRYLGELLTNGNPAE